MSKSVCSCHLYSFFRDKVSLLHSYVRQEVLGSKPRNSKKKKKKKKILLMSFFFLTLGSNLLRWLTFKCRAKSNDSHSSAKLKKKSVSNVSQITSDTQSVLCLTFLMYVRTIKSLNYGGQESKGTICNLWFLHTCDLETRSKSSILVWIGRPQARL